MRGCVLWSWDLGGHGAHAGPRPLLSPLRDLRSRLHHRRMSGPIALGPARSPHTCQKPEGCWGPTELMGAARAGAPARKSPGHGGAVLGAAAGGLRTRDGSTCTFETPGFLLGPHSRRHTCLRLSFLLILASRFTPNPVLTCSVDSGKPGLCQKRQRDRAQHLLPRGYSKATPASGSTATGTRAIGRGHESYSDFIYMV